jgi:hypothetical protein
LRDWQPEPTAAMFARARPVVRSRISQLRGSMLAIAIPKIVR